MQEYRPMIRIRPHRMSRKHRKLYHAESTEKLCKSADSLAEYCCLIFHVYPADVRLRIALHERI